MLSLSMFVGCYLAGSIPLVLSLSEVARDYTPSSYVTVEPLCYCYVSCILVWPVGCASESDDLWRWSVDWYCSYRYYT